MVGQPEDENERLDECHLGALVHELAYVEGDSVVEGQGHGEA